VGPGGGFRGGKDLLVRGKGEGGKGEKDTASAEASQIEEVQLLHASGFYQCKKRIRGAWMS